MQTSAAHSAAEALVFSTEVRQPGPKPGTGPAAAVAAALCEAVNRATAQERPQANLTGKRSARKRPAQDVADPRPTLTSPDRRSPARPATAESRSGHTPEPARRIQPCDFDPENAQLEASSSLPAQGANNSELNEFANRQTGEAQVGFQLVTHIAVFVLTCSAAAALSADLQQQ